MPRILLIGWDAADWKVIRPLMDAGQMPNVARLVRDGASGEIATLHPPLSPMLWTSIATGKRPFKHGIHGFAEPAPDGSGVRPITNLSRTCKALWNIFSQNDLRSTVIGWWPSHPAEPIRGVTVSDHYHRARGPLDEGWPLPPHLIHPAELTGPLAALRVHPDMLTPEMVEPFIPLAREIDQDKDKRLSACLRTLAECMSIQAAALWLLDHQPADFFAVYFDAIDHFCHSFMRYHPPRQSWIAERDFELYHNVVSMAYRFHDHMLGELLDRAGDATVMLMSDHGFHPDHLRPAAIPDIPAGPAIEHRDWGVLAIRGTGIKQGETLHGASLLDIAPTILTLYGLPVGEDMDGKVLSRAFVETPNIAFVPSWEQIPGADGRHPEHTRLDPVAAQEALEQMIALGYIERPDQDRETTIRKTVRELRYNLGEAYQDAGRHLEAREIFAELAQADPDEQRFSVRLFVSCQALGELAEMRRIVDELAGREAPVTDYLHAQVLIAEKRYAEALAALERVREGRLLRPGLFLEIADLCLRLRRWRDARRVYEDALAVDPDNAQAHLGLCRIALRQRKFSVAAHAALDALDKTYHDPQAHFLLGRALTGMHEHERAADAFRAAISLNPNFPEAHAMLRGAGTPAIGTPHRPLARSPLRPLGSATLPTGTPAPLSDSLIVATGLPRSGTSLLMQMLAAGGLDILADNLRPADEDNPHGYLEFAPVKALLRDAKWLWEARGKAVKIVVPLLGALPPGLPCRVILCERDLDEVLASQERLLLRHNQAPRRGIKDEYRRMLARAEAMLTRRPATQFLIIEHRAAISDPRATAANINQFLGGCLDAGKMAAAVDPALYRNRALETQAGGRQCESNTPATLTAAEQF